jgi:HSP20 family protein
VSGAAAALTEPGRSLGLPVDVYAKGDESMVEVDVPGIDPEKLGVTIERNMLAIMGERPAVTDERAR